jgi:hypothetical protein
MRALLTVARPDGSFPTVGGVGRVFTGETSRRGIRQRARNLQRAYRGAAVLVTEFVGSIYGEPSRVWALAPVAPQDRCPKIPAGYGTDPRDCACGNCPEARS